MIWHTGSVLLFPASSCLLYNTASKRELSGGTWERGYTTVLIIVIHNMWVMYCSCMNCTKLKYPNRFSVMGCNPFMHILAVDSPTVCFSTTMMVKGKFEQRLYILHCKDYSAYKIIILRIMSTSSRSSTSTVHFSGKKKTNLSISQLMTLYKL